MIHNNILIELSEKRITCYYSHYRGKHGPSRGATDRELDALRSRAAAGALRKFFSQGEPSLSTARLLDPVHDLQPARTSGAGDGRALVGLLQR